ncbi:hypothetical protein CRE_13176 [Caenorhabditis remanei]|uniref:Uncharacterized protein n=1 Tax=Caenorhabditis remanei TaxID=31234 RepID=E3NNL5_CAERE|nr:hypothetical protein CRE_13176 [Caenorhabditis remanei]
MVFIRSWVWEPFRMDYHIGMGCLITVEYGNIWKFSVVAYRGNICWQLQLLASISVHSIPIILIMKTAAIIFLCLITLTIATDLQEAQGQFCSTCNKNWEEKVPKSWAEVTAYLNLACFQLHATLKPRCMALVNDFNIGKMFDTFRPQLIDFGNAVCDMYCN